MRRGEGRRRSLDDGWRWCHWRASRPAHSRHVASGRLPPARTRPLGGRHGGGRWVASDPGFFHALFSPSAFEALVGVAGSGEGRACNAWVSLTGQVQVDQAVEIVEDFGVAQDRGAPVSVNAALQFSMSFGNLDLQLVQGGGMEGRLAGILNVDGVEGQRGKVSGVGDPAGRAQALEKLEDMGAGMADDPVSASRVSRSRRPGQAGLADLISRRRASMARDSACLTASSRRSASQEHSWPRGAGLPQMAQLGVASESMRAASIGGYRERADEALRALEGCIVGGRRARSGG